MESQEAQSAERSDKQLWFAKSTPLSTVAVRFC